MNPLVHVVDDEPSLVWVVKQFLRMNDYRIATSYRGQEALLAMEQETPDLVLLDILMPDMDGFTVLRHMRTIPSLMKVPVIFLTAKGELPAKLAGFEHGADDYIVKPFDMEELDLRIRAILRRSEAPVSTPIPHLDRTHYVLSAYGNEVRLTPSESAIAGFLLDRIDQMVSSEELLHIALGYASGTGNLATVRFHIRSLRSKLQRAGVENVNIQTIGHSGYLLSLS